MKVILTEPSLMACYDCAGTFDTATGEGISFNDPRMKDLTVR